MAPLQMLMRDMSRVYGRFRGRQKQNFLCEMELDDFANKTYASAEAVDEAVFEYHKGRAQVYEVFPSMQRTENELGMNYASYIEEWQSVPQPKVKNPKASSSEYQLPPPPYDRRRRDYFCRQSDCPFHLLFVKGNSDAKQRSRKEGFYIKHAKRHTCRLDESPVRLFPMLEPHALEDDLMKGLDEALSRSSTYEALDAVRIEQEDMKCKSVMRIQDGVLEIFLEPSGDRIPAEGNLEQELQALRAKDLLFDIAKECNPRIAGHSNDELCRCLLEFFRVCCAQDDRLSLTATRGMAGFGPLGLLYSDGLSQGGQIWHLDALRKTLQTMQFLTAARSGTIAWNVPGQPMNAKELVDRFKKDYPGMLDEPVESALLMALSNDTAERIIMDYGKLLVPAHEWSEPFAHEFLNRGDVQVMTGDTVHAGPPNRSGKPRACLFALAMPGTTMEESSTDGSDYSLTSDNDVPSPKAWKLARPVVPHDVTEQYTTLTVLSRLVDHAWPGLQPAAGELVRDKSDPTLMDALTFQKMNDVQYKARAFLLDRFIDACDDFTKDRKAKQVKETAADKLKGSLKEMIQAKESKKYKKFEALRRQVLLEIDE